MKFLSSLIAHIEALKAKNHSLREELEKVRDFFEGRASADGAARTRKENQATAAGIEDLHAKIDAVVNEAQASVDQHEAVPEPGVSGAQFPMMPQETMSGRIIPTFGTERVTDASPGAPAGAAATFNAGAAGEPAAQPTPAAPAPADETQAEK